MNTLKKPVNILFLISIGAIAVTFFVFNFLIFQKEKEKNKAQTQKARDTIQKNSENKTLTNENFEPLSASN